MSSEKYQDVHTRLLTDAQREAIHRCYMKGINHDGHSWVTFTDVEELVVELFSDNNSTEDK